MTNPPTNKQKKYHTIHHHHQIVYARALPLLCLYLFLQKKKSIETLEQYENDLERFLFYSKSS